MLAEETVQSAVAATNKGVISLGGPARSALTSFLDVFSASVDESASDATTLTLDYNPQLPAIGSRSWKVQTIFADPKLSADALAALAGRSAARSSLEAELTNFDDVAASLSYTWNSRRFGRDIAPHRAMFAVLAEASVPGVDSDFSAFLNNQPQLFVTGQYHRRRDVIGPQEWSARLTWEIGSQNLNGFYRAEGHQCAGGAEACLAAFRRYVARTARARTADRLALSVAFARSSETHVELITPYDIAAARSVILTATYGRPFASLTGRLDLTIEYTGTTNAPDVATQEVTTQLLSPPRTRFAAAATYTQKITNRFSIPLSVVYSDRIEDLPGQPMIISPPLPPQPHRVRHDGFAVHLGVTYRVPSRRHSNARIQEIQEGLEQPRRDELTRQIRAALQRLIEKVDALHAALHPVSCGAAKCYAASDVDAAIAAIRQGAREAIPSEALPLQVAVGAEIDRITTMGAPAPPPVLQYVRMPPDSPGPGYDAAETDSMFAAVQAYLRRLSGYQSYTPSVDFRSEPDSAAYEIYMADRTTTTHKGRTNEAVPAIWRGVYAGTARKAGYKSAEITLDLMDDRPHVTYKCILYKLNAPLENESYCRAE